MLKSINYNYYDSWSGSQDDIARTILHLAGSEVEAEPVDPSHLAAVLEGLAQAKRREFATDNEAEAALRCFDR
jgi:hypothetical protein